MTVRLRCIFAIAASFSWASVSLAQAVDVTSTFATSASGYVFNRASQTYNSVLSLTNIGVQNAPAPLRAVISPNSTFVTLSNAAGTTSSGAPYVVVPTQQGFVAPNESVKVVLQFKNPKNASFTYGLAVLSGADVSPIKLIITSPVAPTDITGPRILLTGTIQAPPGSGVNVGNAAACVVGTQFFANDVSLVAAAPYIFSDLGTNGGPTSTAETRPNRPSDCGTDPVAWAATIATKRIASVNSEGLLWAAYLGTFAVTTVSGATVGVVCYRLLESV